MPTIATDAALAWSLVYGLILRTLQILTKVSNFRISSSRPLGNLDLNVTIQVLLGATKCRYQMASQSV